jgi:cell division septal protein FtsQ
MSIDEREMFARTAQHIEPKEKPMRIEVYDYAKDPERHGPEGGTVITLACVMIAALFVGVLIAVWRMW